MAIGFSLFGHPQSSQGGGGGKIFRFKKKGLWGKFGAFFFFAIRI